MKHVKITLQLITYSFAFLLFLNFSDAKADKMHEKRQDCRGEIEQINQDLRQDPDGILDEGQVESYEECVASMESEMKSTDGWLDDVSNFIFLLDCYTNLLDYYNAAGNEDKVNELDDKIYAITE